MVTKARIRGEAQYSLFCSVVDRTVCWFFCRGSGLDRTKSIIHRRGDSFSSLRSDEGGETSESMEPRPIFFLHGVGLGLVSYYAASSLASGYP